MRGESVINVESDQASIEQGIQRLLSNDFQQRLPAMLNPYYQDNSAEKAYELIKAFLADENKDKPKRFYDLENK